MNDSRDSLLRRTVVLLGVVLLCSAVTTAQTDLEKAMQQYNSSTIGGYMQPIADLFGANMHAGYYHSAYIPHWGSP